MFKLCIRFGELVFKRQPAAHAVDIMTVELGQNSQIVAGPFCRKCGVPSPLHHEACPVYIEALEAS